MASSPATPIEPPPLPPVLLKVWPVVLVGALGWVCAAAVALLIPALHSWRPIALAGLGVTVVGTSIFVWQLAAARRGTRGAQSGLENYLDT